MGQDQSLHVHDRPDPKVAVEVPVELASPIAWKVAVWLGYAAISLFVTITWFHYARTEILSANAPFHFNSIVQMADGTAPRPFVRRRLMPDAASALTILLPASESPTWDHFLALDRRVCGYFLNDQSPIATGWSREKLPLLAASLTVMAGSVLGFIFVCSALIRHFYVVAPRVADILSGLLGVALLGGCNDMHYQLYPYDFTQAFVFSLTLLGMLQQKWWFVPAFLLAAYSKETSGLLVAAYVLISWAPGVWRSWGWCLRVLLLTATYGAIRAYIAWRYPGFEPRPFWFPGKNARWLVTTAILSAWLVPFLVVPTVRIIRSRDKLPKSLARLALLIPILVGVAFFKGWIEELRQYTELLPIGALIVAQWAATELGAGHLLVPRERNLAATGGA